MKLATLVVILLATTPVWGAPTVKVPAQNRWRVTAEIIETGTASWAAGYANVSDAELEGVVRLLEHDEGNARAWREEATKELERRKR